MGPSGTTILVAVVGKYNMAASCQSKYLTFESLCLMMYNNSFFSNKKKIIYIFFIVCLSVGIHF